MVERDNNLLLTIDEHERHGGKYDEDCVLDPRRYEVNVALESRHVKYIFS